MAASTSRRAILVRTGAVMAAAVLAVSWYRRRGRCKPVVRREQRSADSGLPAEDPNPFSLEDVPGLLVGGKVEWVAGTGEGPEQCWYRVQTGEHGRFMFVAASQHGRVLLCDHSALAAALQLERVLGESSEVSPNTLPLGDLVVRRCVLQAQRAEGRCTDDDSELVLCFQAGGKRWQWTDGKGLLPGMPLSTSASVLRPGAQQVTRTLRTGAAVRLEVGLGCTSSTGLCEFASTSCQSVVSASHAVICTYTIFENLPFFFFRWLKQFRNESNSAARVFWLDGTGKRRDCGHLAAGGGVWTQSTYAGHAWVVVGSDDLWCAGLETPDCGGVVVISTAFVAEATAVVSREQVESSDTAAAVLTPVISPNGRWEASVQSGNVVIRSHLRCTRGAVVPGENEQDSWGHDARLLGKFTAMTTVDGVPGVDAFEARSLSWSPDSCTLAVLKVGVGVFILPSASWFRLPTVTSIYAHRLQLRNLLQSCI